MKANEKRIDHTGEPRHKDLSLPGKPPMGEVIAKKTLAETDRSGYLFKFPGYQPAGKSAIFLTFHAWP